MKVNAVVKRVETKLYKRKSGERNKDKYKYKAICEYVVNEKKYTYETDFIGLFALKFTLRKYRH